MVPGLWLMRNVLNLGTERIAIQGARCSLIRCISVEVVIGSIATNDVKYIAKTSLSSILYVNQTTAVNYNFYNVTMRKEYNRNGNVSSVQISVYRGD